MGSPKQCFSRWLKTGGGGGEEGRVGRAELFPNSGNCHGWHDRGLIVLSTIRNPHGLKVFP